ncbi:hypothetical protein DFQ26_006330 [Actinomortierella ambigua]|nr:hypothetical protein DFQ26_006330 [Actinomortierella ambigua]
MTDHAELIANFVAVVGATPEQAEFYLEANNWNIDAAMSNYYDEPNADIASRTARSEASIEQEDYSEIEDDLASPSMSSTAAGKRKATNAPPGGRKGGIATLRDFSKDGTDDESSEDEEGQNYFAGGEKSGVMLQGPPGKKKDTNDIVSSLLKKAAEAGSRPHPDDEDDEPPKATYFTGSGNRLGSDEIPSVVVPATESGEPQRLERAVRTLTFWRNGFSIEDGPLIAFNDPAGREILSAVDRGEAPLKVMNVQPGQSVDVRVARRESEDYVPPPKAPPKPFEGTGNRLGGLPSAGSSGSGNSGITPGSFPSSGGSNPTNVPAPLRVEVDPSLPTTSIQIRLADGSRMVAKFNHTHTVNDIRGYINASQVGEASRSYILQTTFPKTDLTDLSQTIKDAGLLNAVVLQRLL